MCMNVCVWVCVHVWLNICMCICVCVYKNIRMRVCMWVCMYVCRVACLCVCMSAFRFNSVYCSLDMCIWKSVRRPPANQTHPRPQISTWQIALDGWDLPGPSLISTCQIAPEFCVPLGPSFCNMDSPASIRPNNMHVCAHVGRILGWQMSIPNEM